MAAAFAIPHQPGFGGASGGMASVKDAAIRALAEIGDPSVVPVLMAEWERRSSGGGRTSKSTPAWNNARQQTVANTYGPDWVADAIEQLMGARPKLERSRRDGSSAIIWYVGDDSLERAYRAAFMNVQAREIEGALAAAKKLMPLASESERAEARKYISTLRRVPTPAELEQQVQMIELLAAYDAPQSILNAMSLRLMNLAIQIDQRDLDGKAAAVAVAVAAYVDCAIRIIHASKDWKTTLVPSLIEIDSVDIHSVPATVVLLNMLNELDRQQQVDCILITLQFIGAHGTNGFVSYLENMAAWLDDDSHRSAIEDRLRNETGVAWVYIVVGLFRSGLADDGVKQIMTSRFADESIDRKKLLESLIASLDEQPDLVQVLADLIEHPALDAPASVMVTGGVRTEFSLRAQSYLSLLKEVPKRHRPRMMGLLQELAKSGKNGEQDTARAVLNEWKE